MSGENRVDTMAAKLAAYARRAGISERDIVAAYELAVERRVANLRDVFHPDLLHPARTVLILLEDAGVSDPHVLTAAALTETEFAQLRVPESDMLAAFDRGIAELSRAVPQPAQAGDSLLEELLATPHDAGLIAVAERLDHARHLHFRDPVLWPPFHAQIVAAYLPFAGRTSEPLARRLSRWSHAFQRRFLLSA